MEDTGEIRRGNWAGRITGGDGLPGALRGGIVAIGNFDGVHRGHQAVLSLALESAASKSVPALVLTFEPHPRTVFGPGNPVFRLSPAPVRARLLRNLGFSAVVEYPFDMEFAGRSAEAFVCDVLVGELGISGAVTGVDFHFGKNRQGGPAFLMDAGQKHGFTVDLVDAFRDEGAEIVSSSRIRQSLRQGDVSEANGLLGYRYSIEGEVVRGKQLGRTLGYPTANFHLPEETGLCHGIYAVRLRRADGSLHDGVASFGRRPTIEDDGKAVLEVFVFDFTGDLYGEICTVSLFGYLRGEEKFDRVEALVEQMKRDDAEARALLSGVAPLSELDLAMAFAS
ncbi:MAG: bifunctional riboflavin kinase/FAD synthetase [Rhizobiaceae bacterium]